MLKLIWKYVLQEIYLHGQKKYYQRDKINQHLGEIEII